MLAIILSVIYFSILPLIANGLIWSVHRHFENVRNQAISENLAEAGMGIPPELITGIEGLPEINLWQVLMSILFFIVAVFAWRGRPPGIRYVLMIAIISVTLFNLALTLSIPSPDLTQGLDSSAEFSSSIARLNLGGGFLVVAYVLWYINRAPSRAFYRGYYLPEPKTQAERKQGA
jgi:hypothetical protein